MEDDVERICEKELCWAFRILVRLLLFLSILVLVAMLVYLKCLYLLLIS